LGGGGEGGRGEGELEKEKILMKCKNIIWMLVFKCQLQQSFPG
jgi:hypothetical protein